MIGLFYPAVLGAIFYSLMDFLTSSSWSLEAALSLLVSLGILLHFTIDYVEIAAAHRDYTSVMFLIDIGVLFFLFLAFDRLNYPAGPPAYGQVGIALSLVYILYVLYDLLGMGGRRYQYKAALSALACALLFASTAMAGLGVFGLLVLLAIGSARNIWMMRRERETPEQARAEEFSKDSALGTTD